MTEDWHITNISNYPATRPEEGKAHTFFVEWRYVLADGDSSAQDYGYVALEYTHEKEWFAYDDLSEATVIRWVQDALGEDTITSMKEVLAAIIERYKQPVASPKPLPWNK